MAKKAVVGAIDAEKAAAKAKADAAKAAAKSDVVRVQFEGGVREYSKEVHGENFAELAAEFASKDERRKVL